MTTDYVIVGDFNIHHPSWGCKTTQADNQATQLLEIIDEFNLTQHLPSGTTTYISRLELESTINLVFTSAGLTERIQMCDVVEALNHDSDHLPIGTILDLSFQNTAPDTRYSYNQTNTKVFNITLLELLPFTPTISPTSEVLDTYVTQLIKIISHAVHISTPQTVPNVRVTPCFDRFCKAACVKANKARRHLKEETRQDPKSRVTKQAYFNYRNRRDTKSHSQVSIPISSRNRKYPKQNSENWTPTYYTISPLAIQQ